MDVDSGKQEGMIRVRGRRCPYDPEPLLGQPIGQLHCPSCGCMVIAGIEHGPCLPNLCPLLDAQGNDMPERPHPGMVEMVDLTAEEAEMLGLIPDSAGTI
jgi:hypothetical protein